MIVEKAVHMARMMNIPVLGIVENMAYFVCDDCGKRHYIFGESRLETLAKENAIPSASQLPLDTHLAAAIDRGNVESLEAPWLEALADALIHQTSKSEEA